MSISKEDKIFDDEEIRDTNDHTSGVSESRGFSPKTIMVCNEHDEEGVFQLQGSIDSSFTHIFLIGGTFSIAADTCEYETLEDYFPYLRVIASYATAPTTGALDMWIAKRTG